MSIAIKAENISKAYQLGEIGTGTLSRDIERWISKVRGKGDPFLKIGEINDRTQKGNSDIVWSLKDINFEIERGDAVGIIGRNGAGKSTLLKILSRVTSPTKGLIKGNGRVASLLEVGTGFHPELTGRDNIYLNGAILGMRKYEISKKFDEIIDFAGVERYINTPVKRYSSGMYVRLAFAVAAHLESEILIVDEVLAVGDAEFQSKCLGKMGEVSKGEGRTVLFVSHNMGAVSQLCKKGILLNSGKILDSGKVNKVLEAYNNINKSASLVYENYKVGNCGIMYVKIQNEDKTSIFTFDNEIKIYLKVNSDQANFSYHIGIAIYDQWNRKLFTTVSKVKNEKVGAKDFLAVIPKNLLLSGKYSIDVSTFMPNGGVYDYKKNVSDFEIADYTSPMAIYGNADVGAINVPCQWLEI
ncbi:ABC transporter ATP-binding protein [Spirosoma sp. 48-14]|uniref:ABC transporter ATP-binding protein n=1 Tax=Spirosoma sp. 48-14 TaxID=1895854 RepID=UPI0009611CC5|nr:ABC transporter ATP-binding protein [Spirosoma sp. 48-14]OJW75066.1 MAG: hypothetical protein BGO59_19020 [Spirosoma sp. 48-14]